MLSRAAKVRVMSDGRRPRKPPKQGRAKTKAPAGADPAYATSIRDLGRAMHRTHQSISRWLKKPSWPFGNKPGRKWNIAKIRQWQTANLPQNPADKGPAPINVEAQKIAQDHSKAKLDLEQERAAKLRLQRQQREGELLPKEQVEYENVQKIHSIRTVFGALPRNLEAEMVWLRPKDKKRISSILAELIREILEDFANEDHD